jgi:hypothetical protein
MSCSDQGISAIVFFDSRRSPALEMLGDVGDQDCDGGMARSGIAICRNLNRDKS